MDQTTAVLTIEIDEDATYRQELEAWATLIKSGAVWSLQGFYGRGARSLIEDGIISPEGDLTEYAEGWLTEVEG